MIKHVIIVGGGVVGLFCGARLVQTGARVTLLEGEPEDYSGCGPSASLAAAGMLAPLGELAPESPHPRFTELALASFDLWRAWRDGAIWSDGVQFDGGVVVSRTAEERRALLAQAAAHGRPAKTLNAAEFRKRTGLRADVAESVYLADEGVADPGRVLSGLAMEMRQRGAATVYRCEVETIEFDPVRVRTFDDRVFEGDIALIATGWMGQRRMAKIAPAMAHLRPAKGQMAPVALEAPLGANIRAPGFYLAPRGDHGAVLGATFEMDRYDRAVREPKLEALAAAAEALLPGAVRRREGELGWAGVRPMSPDGAPMIGWSGGALIAAGHSRNGWLLAPITAEIICALVYGHDVAPLWAAFAPQRFDNG